MEYNLHQPWLTLDPWQQEYIDSHEHCILVAGRQVGKSTAMSIKIGERARQPRRDILIGALTEKQAYQLYFKTLTYMMARYPKLIVGGKDKPTKHEFRIKNPQGNSVVRAYALGLTGMGMRTFTITDLFIDECREIAREVFISLEPMLSVTKGTKDYASTPGGKQGYFYEMSKPESGFRKFHVNAYECPRHSTEFLEKQRSIMTKVEFAQEYLGEFLESVLRVYPEELLKNVCVLSERGILRKGEYYGGVDVARLGENQSVFSIGDRIRKDYAEQVECVATSKEFTTQAVEQMVQLQRIYKCKEWGVDGGGVGGWVIDQCFRIPELRDRVKDLNNATKPIDADGEKSARLLKEHMYINLLRMMEHNQIKLLNNTELIQSLSNALFEYDEKQKMRIFGPHNDYREAVIRMAWVIAQSKRLNLFAV